MMEGMSRADLNKKWWYRLLKVVYLFGYVVLIGGEVLLVVDGGYNSGEQVYGVGVILFTIVAFELIKRAFYYVVTGTMKLPRREIRDKLDGVGD